MHAPRRLGRQRRELARLSAYHPLGDEIADTRRRMGGHPLETGSDCVDAPWMGTRI